jgi:hypothetical protein
MREHPNARLADGRIRELHEFVWDLFAVDAFWT